MDFFHDQLASERKLRVLTVIDKWYRQCVALQADFALIRHSVVDAMDAIARERELPSATCEEYGGDGEMTAITIAHTDHPAV
jgi:hypothetical protein